MYLSFKNIKLVFLALICFFTGKFVNSQNKTINVNLYANNDPYINSQWNNQLITQPSYPFTSGAYNYSDGTASTVFTTTSASQGPTSSTYADNGAGYNTTMCPPSVGRYASYLSGNRTVTFQGLNNTKQYDIQLYCTRATAQGTTRNTINGVVIDVPVQSNMSNVATFSNITPSGGQIMLSQSVLNTYVYLNGFTITEKTAGNQSPNANPGSPQTIVLPTNQVTLTGSGTDPDGTIASYAWTQLSGTAATIASPSSATTNITGLTTVGARVFRLTVTDNLGATGSNNVTITVNANQSPNANAGSAQTITLPTNQVTLTGSGTDPDGTITSYAWTQISGTAATIGSASSATTNITGLTTAGARVFRLTVTDNGGATGTSDVTVNVNVAGNQSPTANAGSPQTIILPVNQVTFTGSGTDADGTIVSYAWSQVSGTVATISSPSTATTNITGLTTAGVRIFRLTVTDNQGAAGTNDVTITVNNNQSPTANAGSNQTITLPTNQATLNGSGSDADGTIASYAWTQVSGTVATIANPSSATTNITGLTTGGLRVFRLTVTDNLGATGTSDVTITVSSNQSPTANAGGNQIITLPVTTATLTGSGADPDGTIASYAWTQVSGTAATIASSSSATTNITGLTTSGARVFRLTVTDNLGANATSDVTVTVNPASNGKTIPGRIEGENWDVKSGGQYAVATNDVSGVQHVVGIAINNYMDYNVTVVSTSTYNISFRVATSQNNAQFQLRLGATTLATINIPNSGGWGAWSTVTVNNVALTAGSQTLRVISTNTESCNFNWMDFASNNLSPTANAGSNQTITLPTNQVTLTGSGTDADGSIASYTWTQVSGTAATIATPSSASTNITGLGTAGARVFRLTVTDNQGATGTSDVTITVSTSGLLPVVTTDNPQTVTVPSAALTSTSSSGAGIASTRWTKFSVPGQTARTMTVIGSSTAACNGVSGPTGFDSCFVQRFKAYYTPLGILGTVNNIAVAGTSPFDINITTALNYNADILLVSYPSNGYTASTNASVLARLQMFMDSTVARGKQFYITGTQPRNDFSVADRANLIVLNDSLRNRFGARFIDFLTPLLNTTDNTMKPVYNADGIHPNNAGHGIIYEKLKAANIFQNTFSSASVITTPTSANTNITGLTSGVHRYQVSVLDNAGYAASAVAMVSFNTGPNVAPLARAGMDQIITLPVSSVNLNGSTSTDDHAIIGYLWTKLTGTGGIIASPTASTTQFTGLTEGTYIIELRVTDDSTAVSKDTVQITVNPVNPNVGIPNGTLVYGKNTWNNLADFDSTASPRASIVGGKIQIAGGDWTTFNSALTLRDTIAAAHWTGTVRIQMTSPKAANNYGLTAYAKSVNTYSLNSLLIDPDMSNGVNNGRAQFWYNSAGSNNASLFRAGAGSRVAYNQNDKLLMTMTQNCDTIRVYVKNVTTNAAPFDTTFVVPNKIVQASPTNLFEWGISSQSAGGQTVLIDSIGFVVNEPSNATLLLLGDSKTTGVGATNNQRTWAYQLHQNYPSMAITAGGGNRTQDALAHLPEVLALTPKNVLLAIGSNDIRTGVADATWKARYQSITNQLTTAGINVIHLLPMKENSGVDLTAQKDWVIATYPGKYIDTWTPSLTAGFIFSDNIHLSDSGNARVYRAIVQALPPFLGPLANAGSNQTISLPTSQVTLSGSGIAYNGGGLAYSWAQLSGTSATITSITSAVTTVTGLTSPGARVFRLTVTDNQGAIGTSDVIITVNDDSPPPVITTNNPVTIKLPTDIAAVTSAANSVYTITSTKWTKFSVPGQTVKKATVIGSSLSAGNGATTTDSSYVGKLKAYYKTQGVADTVYNLAVSASTVFDINITAALDKGAPVLVAGYSSYGYQGSTYSITAICSKFQEIADSCAGRGVQFYVTGSQPRDDFNATDRQKVKVINDSLRTRFGTRFIDFLTPVLNVADNSIKTRFAAGDGINVNNAGHERLFQVIKAANIFQNTISSASLIANQSASNTSVNNLVDTGVHKFQVSITDNGGYAASAVATITVNPSTPNLPPMANAGNDKTINLPLDSVLLDATSSTDDHNIISYQWTKITGTGGTLTTPSAPTTKFKGLTVGTYTVELAVTDDSTAISKDTIQITVNPPLNQPPVANAGPDQTINQPSTSVSLNGTASTDDHNIVAYQWTKINGAGGTLTTPTSATTTFTGLTPGTYRVELRVTDDSTAVSRDTIQIIVNFPPNVPPVANAGADTVIIVPASSATLRGTTSTDDHGIIGWQWTKLTGAGGTLTTPSASITTFTGLSAGTYTVELRVTDDSSAISRDTVQVTVLGPSILDPADPVITYNPLSPPTPPQPGIIAKWVRTVRVTWPADSWKPYILNSMAFRLKYPPSYNPYANDGKRYPMIIFLHGKGEVAANSPNFDNEFSLANGGPFFTGNVDNGNFDGYVLVPQASTGGWNPSNFTAMMQLVDYMIANNKLDPFHVVLNGLSDGGFNSWETANFTPSKIAARLPMSGTGLANIADTSILKYTPIWHFQGGEDINPAPYTSYLVKTAYDSAGSNFLRNTLYPTLGHGTWDAAWAEPDFLPYIKRAYGANPWPLFGRTEFCPNDSISSVILGVAPGFDAYQWRKDSVIIAGAVTNKISVSQIGKYQTRVRKGTIWSEWSRIPVDIKIKYTTLTPDITVSGLMSRVIPSLDTNRVTLKEPSGYVSYVWQKVGDTTTLSTDSTLSVGTPGNYIAKVTELYSCQNSFSSPFTVVDANGPNKPDAPTSVSVSTVSKTSLKVDWSQNPAPQYNETNFEIYQSLQPGGPYKLAAITAADASTHTITGLSFAGTKYYFKMRAVNNTGASGASNEANGTTDIDAQPPTAPTNLTVSGSTRNAIFLTWTAATDEVGVVAYDVYVDGIKSYATTQTKFTVNALNYAQSYNFTVKAKDFAGNVSAPSNQVTGQPLLRGLNYNQYTFTGNWSNLPNFTPLTPVATGTMNNVALTPRTQNDNFAFLWQGYINIPASGVYYFRTNSDDGSKLYLGPLEGLNSPYAYGATALVDNDGQHGPVDVTSAPDTLVAGVYPIAITYYDQNNSESMVVSWSTPSSGGSFVTIPDNAFTDGTVINGSAPATPSNLAATTASYKRINLTWTDNSGNERGFEVWRSTNVATGFVTVGIAAANITTYGDSVLNASTTYYYKLRAIGQYGESAFSGTVSATTSALPPVTAAPGNLVATGISASAVNITWVQPLQPPSADAGLSQTITLPVSQVTLNGTGTANNGGTITGYAWTQTSGTAASIASPSSATTNVTGMTTAGIRVFRLTVTDNQGSTGTSDVTITVNPIPNGKSIPGIIEAENWDAKSGGQYTTATSDPNGGGLQVVGIAIGNYQDYNVNVAFTGLYTVRFRVATSQNNAQFQIRLGAATLATISIPNTGGWSSWSTVTVNNVSLTAGAQTLRVISTNSESSNFNWMEYIYAGGGSQPPTANAGSNQTVIIPANQATLTGSGTANNGGTITGYAWTQVSGTAATITSPSSSTTTVTGLTTAGARVFRLTVTQNDNQTATSDVTVTVATNQPTANAGANQTIVLPTNQVSLIGTGTANNGGSITGYAWTQLSGTAATITSPSSASTTITGLATTGVRVFRLTVTQNDNQTGTSDVTITVNPSQPPTANAGSAQTITLPTSQVTLTGTGTANNGGTITGYAWTQLSGTAATITTASAAITTVTGMTTSGVRVFRLTVTDNQGSTATSDVTITVNPLSNGKTIPGKIEAESWDAKSGGMYAVNTDDPNGGVQHVVGIAINNYLDYNVNVTTTGNYTVTFRVATSQNTGQFQIKLGNTVLGTVSITNTGGWGTWATRTVSNVALTAGAQTLRIQSINNESCNFNWMDFALNGGNMPVTNGNGKNVTAVENASEVNGAVSFNLPEPMSSSSSGAITSYQLYRSSNNNSNYLLLATLPPGTTSYVDSSLFANAVYYYKVKAINAGGGSPFSNEDSALTANHPPVITNIVSRSARYGVTTVIPVTATDADAGVLTFTTQNKPAFATLIDNGDRTATLTLNPALADQGVYNNIRIIVSDANGGKDTTSFNLTVNDNFDPTITTIANYSVIENDSLTIPLKGADQNSTDSLRWTISNLPALFTLTAINKDSATLGLRPTFADAGVYIVQADVSDGNGGTATRQFTLTIIDRDPATKIYARVKYINDIGAPWNSMTGITTTNLLDEYNNTTTVGIAFQQPFWAPFNAGPTTGNNSGVYPDAVLNEFWYFGYGAGPETASLQVTGLNPAKKYNLTFYGGSVFNGVADNGTTNYTVGGQTVSLYVQNNTQNTVSINSIIPAANGTITVSMAKAANTPVGYLNALVINQLFDDGSVPAVPKTLTAQYIFGQGAKLTWQDAAYNETGYQIYRSLSAAGTYTLVGTTQSEATTYTDSTVSGLTLYYYKIRAINSYGNSAYSNIVSILTPNRIPTISPIADVTIKNNQTLAVNVTAVDDLSDHITLTASGLPSFATFADNGNGTGVVNLQPVVGSLGVYPGIIITAKDNSDSSRSTSFTIYVTDANMTSTYVNITDFSNPATIAPWNNMTVVYLPFAGTSVTNLKDDGNINTGISVSLPEDWEAVSTTGMRRRNGSELYPEAVSRAGIYFTNSATHHLTVSGLNPAKKYNFVFYNSHNTSESTLTNFNNGSQTVSLNGCHNSNKTVQLNGIVPAANGVVTINVTKGAGSLSALLSAMVIQSYTPGVVSVFSPAELRVADYTAGNAITLQWQDRADNETAYEVWRANDGGTYTLQATLGANTTSYIDGNVTTNVTYNYTVRARNGAASSGYSNVTRGHTYASIVYINVNTNSPAAAPWNNLNWIYGVGAVWNNFKNDTGVPTNIGMVQPVKIDGMVSPGVNTGNNSGVFPDAVLAEAFGLFPGITSYIKITGLHLSRAYDITMTASITGVYGDNSTAYTINGKTCLFNTNANKDGTLTMFGIVPDQNGEIRITFTGIPGVTFALLGAIVIKGYTPFVLSAPAVPGGVNNNTNLQLLLPVDITPVVVQPSKTITVYPNPFSEEITLSLPDVANNESIRVLISDASGKAVYERQYDNLIKGNNILRIQPGNGKTLPPGIYFVRVMYNGKGEEKTIKIIKQR